ncbi:ABC transporter ATP-binding protein [uncultured Vagococcus sp.]|uniref:ABC transporter ATP-binding protein n=1 Tax=uncultured Vagococcus sp. TaxID=189676 RepID=UPI0028D05642|nr:ABC transporter ATP-binding protein [uncultured Vagococcus sp.]
MNKVKETAKAKDISVTLKRLLSYLKGSRYLLILALSLAIIGTLCQVLMPKMLGNSTTLIFNSLGNPVFSFTPLLRQLLLVGSLMVGVFLTTFAHQRLMLVISQRVIVKLRSQLKAKMNRLPVSFLEQQAKGKLMSIAVNDLENIVNTLQSGLTEMIGSFVMLIGVFFFMLTISWQLTVVAVLLIPASLLVMKGLTPHTQKHNQTYLAKQGDLNTHIEETYQGFALLKSYNHEEAELATFRTTNNQMAVAGWKAQSFGGSMMPTLLSLQNVVYILIAVLGGLKVMSGTITIGDMQAFLQYSGEFSHPLIQTGQIWNDLLSATASAKRVFAILDETEVPDQPAYLAAKESQAKVEFEDVTFGYDQPLLKGFNLAVTPGETVAIVGHTGAGKSTLINLLERFYELQGGVIRIDGVDTRQLSYQDLRQRLGMVLQDTWLFSGTILENLQYGNNQASFEELKQSAKAAYADEFIQMLPDGYQTILNEEVNNLSQGQKQLITIARAFVANPEILILDEATSNVDSRTELLIQKGMKELTKGRTSFVVAHRLSTIYDADRILVMKEGQIVEMGSHQELLIQNGEYADIYYSQFAQKAA